jgi:hypothetical protein
MRVVGSLSLILIFFFAAIFVVDGQADPTVAPTIPPPPGQSYETPQPTWTYSPDEIAIYNQLLSETGFDHPKLMMVARIIAQYPNDDIRTFQLRKNVFKDVAYTFVYFPSRTSMFGFVLFANQHGTVRLVSEYTAFVAGLEEIADRNGNGLPDFAFTEYSGGNCCPPTHLFVFEIQTDGSVKNITPNGRGDAQELIDIDGDGIFEIKGVSWITPFHELGNTQSRYINLIRWYGWDGNAYVDVSAQYPDLYEPEIVSLRRTLESTGCSISDNTAAIQQIILDYYAIGRLQEDWQELRSTFNWDTCTDQGFSEYLLRRLQNMVDTKINSYDSKTP